MLATKDRSKYPYINKSMLKQKELLRLKRLSGHTPKMFAILYDNKRSFDKKLGDDITTKKRSADSLFFGDLFRSLLSGKSSYVTYLNEGFKGKNKKDIIIPDGVACLIKTLMANEEYYINEVLGSRLGNYLGVETVYNIAHSNSPDKDDWFQTRYDYLISVDYEPEGYKTMTFENLGCNFDEDTPLQDILTEIDRALARCARTGKLKLDIEQIRALKQNFTKQYLFKNILCEDFDFQAKNLAFMYNANGDFLMAPCFDMEYCFKGGRSHTYLEEVVHRDFAFIGEIMPNVLVDFVKRCEHGLDSGEMRKIVFDTMKPKNNFGLEYRRKIFSKLERNIIQMSNHLIYTGGNGLEKGGKL